MVGLIHVEIRDMMGVGSIDEIFKFSINTTFSQQISTLE